MHNKSMYSLGCMFFFMSMYCMFVFICDCVCVCVCRQTDGPVYPRGSVTMAHPVTGGSPTDTLADPNTTHTSLFGYLLLKLLYEATHTLQYVFLLIWNPSELLRAEFVTLLISQKNRKCVTMKKIKHFQ